MNKSSKKQDLNDLPEDLAGLSKHSFPPNNPESPKEQEIAAQFEAQVLRTASLNALLAGTVHEISQPLNAIKVLAMVCCIGRKWGGRLI
jgi:signal transduction histidine kinase